MKNTIKLVANKNDRNLRLDTFVSKKIDELSRTKIKNIILSGGLKLNNFQIKDPSKKIIIGDNINFEIPNIKKVSLKPFKYKLDIVYEDNDLMVINKAAGISMHPGAGNYDNTLVNALMNLKNRMFSNIGDDLRPGIVHRIDKDTSGLVLIAKNNKTHEILSNQFSDHSISRVYHALIWGKLRPQRGKVVTLITRSSKNRQMMEVGVSKGKKAITNYKTLEIFESDKVPTMSLVECVLETGRTHQIRVHMSYKGNNVLGDKKYKKRFKKIKNIDPNLEKSLLNLNRQFLHAKLLGFEHPRTGQRLNFSSNLPKDLQSIIKKLRNSS